MNVNLHNTTFEMNFYSKDMELTILINYIISSFSLNYCMLLVDLPTVSTICIYKNNTSGTYQNHSEWFSNGIGSFELTALVFRLKLHLPSIFN